MVHGTAQATIDHVQVLFGVGTCAGLSDGELLERFLGRRDEGGELAFESLVTRHGPMVMRVCRGFLDDPNDVHDAFQAVFLVLARRGGAIRDRRSIGSWLYGVALRVAAHHRVAVFRRHVRDRRTTEAAQKVATDVPNLRATPQSERNDWIDVVASGGEPAAGEISRADRALLPRRSYSRRRGRATELAGRDGPQQAGTGAG